MSLRLHQKIAIITGSSSGIGRAIALAFASEGATIICSDLREAARPEPATSSTSTLTTTQELANLGAKSLFVKCDTTSSSDVQALIQRAVETFGRVDIMVNNAGISVESEWQGEKPIWEYEEEALERTMQVNIKGVFLGTKWASKQMVLQDAGPGGDKGWIINLSSIFGLVGKSGLSGYSASKHAVMGITRSAALDCAPHNIHVNALCPGYTATALIAGVYAPQAAEVRKQLDSRHPLKGMGTPQQVARAAVFLASEDAAWVTGVGLPVDGGYSCL
ncbi:short-chain alcohol dehydrogenase [Pyrenophora seminiperda CCB06]|uniref:Short-chain alcohol dehydrogenase n=1 Tax=Pyrenophora seminiperda CCB06 TaxID=1302712 RepID=A0A3M7MBS1_9PLEO|nr:short-chain alcohol dehydrogenase [Pyrenophora seminiperda CCB06]